VSTERAKKIKIILFDVDGVLTDGTIWLLPSPAQGASGPVIQGRNMIEAKGFHAHDGAGISLARLGGLKSGMVTKRVSETVALRARDLKMDYVFQGADNKAAVLDEILASSGVHEDAVAYVGDDVIDLPIMRRCGLAIAVANAREAVKAVAHYQTPSRGGEGAGRDAIEYILKAQGTLDRVIEAYIQARTSIFEQ